MDIVNAHFRQFYPADLGPEMFRFSSMLGGMYEYKDRAFSTIFPSIECADGFTVSVQGHCGAYSYPRDDFAEKYTKVELGYPSEHEPLLDEYQDGAGDPTDMVYGYVPIEVVEEIVKKHGGLAPTPDTPEDGG